MRFKQPNCKRLQGAADERRRARRRTFVLQVPDNKADAVPCERLQKCCDSESEVKYLCFSSEVNEMGTTVQYHVGEEFILVNLTSFCTGNSDAYWYFIFDKVWQIIIGTITGSCFFRKIPGGIGPCHSGIDEENIHRVPFSMGNFC
jgi:hypothetical protein